MTSRDVLMLIAGALFVTLGVMVTAYFKNHVTAVPVDSASITVPWVPEPVKRWQNTIVEMGNKYNVSPDLIAIIITLESGGDPKAHSEADAQGLMQVTPLTAADIASKHLKKPVKQYDLYDPKTNIEFGIAYLAWLRGQFGTAHQGPSWNETVELMAAGYNGGPGAANALEKGEGLNDTQTVIYSRDAFNMWRERHSSTSPTYNRWLERGGQTLVDAATQ